MAKEGPRGDRGFAPNPFYGYCTLACCKPKIRRAAQPDDWIVGLTPKAECNRIVYAMHVAEKITFADYWRDTRFARKKADIRSSNLKHQRGDNIYEPLNEGGYRQHPSMHSKGFAEDEKAKRKDLSGGFAYLCVPFSQPAQSSPRHTHVSP
jgi:Nucleotide modification associated domain 2